MPAGGWWGTHIEHAAAKPRPSRPLARAIRGQASRGGPTATVSDEDAPLASTRIGGGLLCKLRPRRCALHSIYSNGWSCGWQGGPNACDRPHARRPPSCPRELPPPSPRFFPTAGLPKGGGEAVPQAPFHLKSQKLPPLGLKTTCRAVANCRGRAAKHRGGRGWKIGGRKPRGRKRWPRERAAPAGHSLGGKARTSFPKVDGSYGHFCAHFLFSCPHSTKDREELWP